MRTLGFTFALVIFIAATSLGAWLTWDFFKPGGVSKASVEGVLVAAGVDLAREREIVTKEGVELWKIEVASVGEKDRILKGLRMTVAASNGKWKAEDEITREKDVVHLVNLVDEHSETLRLFIIVPKKSQGTRPAQNNHKPIRPAQTGMNDTGKRQGTSPAQQPKPQQEVAEHRSPAEYEPQKPQSTTIDLGQPTIAIILDDIGQREPKILEPVLTLKYPITFAVLPFLTYSSQNAHYLHRNRYEIMLHMPMEPDNAAANPGTGAVYAHFSMDQARDAVDRAMDNVPFIKGVNNHMGSKVTANGAVMSPILEQIKKRDLFFVDSRTRSNTVAYAIARKMGMKTAKRDVFLDSEMTYAFVVQQLKETCREADARGIAIAIGHPYPTTLQALADELPKMDQAGYRFVFASTIIEALHGNL